MEVKYGEDICKSIKIRSRKGVLSTGISHFKVLGDKALLLCDDIVWRIVGENFIYSMEKGGMDIIHVPFNGEASITEIDLVSEIGQSNGCDLVIGLGDVKTIDAYKAIVIS